MLDTSQNGKRTATNTACVLLPKDSIFQTFSSNLGTTYSIFVFRQVPPLHGESLEKSKPISQSGGFMLYQSQSCLFLSVKWKFLGCFPTKGIIFIPSNTRPFLVLPGWNAHNRNLWIPVFLWPICCLNSYFKIHTSDTYKLPWVTTKASRYSKGQVGSVRSSSLIRLAIKLQAKDCCALLPVLTLFLSLWSTHYLCFGPSQSDSLRRPRKAKQTSAGLCCGRYT